MKKTNVTIDYIQGIVDEIVSKSDKEDKKRRYDFEISDHKENRTLKANSYYWVLVSKLAKKMKLTNDEIHFKMIRDYSSVLLLPLMPEQEPERYFKYFDKYKETEINDKQAVYYKVYQPSSLMTQSEFSRLLDGLMDECQEQGIETATPEELSRMEGYCGKNRKNRINSN